MELSHDNVIEVQKKEDPLFDINGVMNDAILSNTDQEQIIDQLSSTRTETNAIFEINSDEGNLLKDSNSSLPKDKVKEDEISMIQDHRTACCSDFNKLVNIVESADKEIDIFLNNDPELRLENSNFASEVQYEKSIYPVIADIKAERVIFENSSVAEKTHCEFEKDIPQQNEFEHFENERRLSVVKKSYIVQNEMDLSKPIVNSTIERTKVSESPVLFDNKNDFLVNNKTLETNIVTSLSRKNAVRLTAEKQHGHPVFPEDILDAYDIIDRTEVKEIKPSTPNTKNALSFINRFKTAFTHSYTKEHVQKNTQQQTNSLVHNSLVIKLSIEKAYDGEPMQVITMSHSTAQKNNTNGTSMFIYVDSEVNNDEENQEEGFVGPHSDADSDCSSIFNEDDDNENSDVVDNCRSCVVNESKEVGQNTCNEISTDVIDQGLLTNASTTKHFLSHVEKESLPSETSKNIVLQKVTYKHETGRRVTTGGIEIKNVANELFRNTLPFVSKKKSLTIEPFYMFTDGFPATHPTFPSDRRSLIALEIYTTERSYVRGLEIVVLHFMKQIYQNGFMDDKELKTVFGNIESILDLNKEILDGLLERILNWSDNQCIGDVFLMQENKLKIYSEYCTNYDSSDAFLKQKLKKKKEFEIFLNACYNNPVCLPGLTLPSYLITVVQRIPRYVLLLKDLLKRTNSDHQDFINLKNALALMEKIASFLNEQLKQSQCQKALELLQTQITGLKAYYTPERNLVHEGAVCLQTSKKTYQCVLFNDLLVFALKVANKQSVVELALGLKTVWIEDLEGLDPQTTKKDAIGIHTPARSYIMYVGSVSEKKIWLENLNKAIIHHLYGINSNENTNIDQRDTCFTYDDGSIYSGGFFCSKRHGEGTMMWPNQMTYKGQWEDDERNGYGILEYVSGEVYDGLWKDDKQDGFGIFNYANGDIVNCKWKSGQRHGEAVINYKNGDTFNGHFVNDSIEGMGELVCKNGLHYKGKWRRNLKHGKGTLKLPDGSEYSGYFRYGKYHGKGKLIYSNGSSYTGDFECGERCGEGLYIFPGGISYDGQWMHDMKNGKGKMTYENGDEYNGTWYQDMRIGQGVLFYNYGAFYRGQWQDDLKHGVGVMENKDGTSYDGDWEYNKMCGSGTMKYPGGTIYKGFWKDGFPNGKGVLTKASGWSCDGNWVQGKQEGQCKLYDPSNLYEYDGQWSNGLREGKGVEITRYSTYEGEFIEDLRDGNGIEKFSNGMTYEGMWSRGQKHGKGVKKLVNGLLDSQLWCNGVLESSCVLLSPKELPSLQRH